MGVGIEFRGMSLNRDDEVLITNYKDIIRLLCKTDISQDKLENIKMQYQREIDSPRRFEWIQSLEQLLQVLERRGAVSYNKITKLYEIAEKVGPNNRIGSLLNLQSKLLSKQRPPPTQFLFDMSLLSDSVPTLPESVIDCISTNIKNSWQQFARALYIIREETIDRIDESSSDKEEKTRQVLQAYLLESKLQRLGNPYNVLLSSLEKIRRRDVKEKVEDLLMESRNE